jgi:LuxR family transcriptional regulator, maltose regulon positive regulatory protein
MKHCPTCNRIYSDDTLSFCLEDGVPLAAYFQNSQFPDSQAGTIPFRQPLDFQIPPAQSVSVHNQIETGQKIVFDKEAGLSSSPFKQNDWANPRLATKLYLPPVRQTLVARPQLLEKLNEGLKGKLTIISAPPGFGKTSLVTAWHAESELPLAWFSLDEEDNDPTCFADYLLGALQTVDERLGQESGALLQSSTAPPLKIFLASLINEINEHEIEFVLAFDDYHVIHDYGIHEAVSFFIERLSSHVHTIITTRRDPPLPLSRLRARGELKELRAADLRFAEAEAAVFLNDVMKLDLTSGDIAALEERTEGWITGLQLSALSLQGRENKSEFVKEFSGDDRFILDYLLEEVLHHQPEEIQDFLLRTSVLNRLNGSLCNALIESEKGHETLEYLNRSNLFLIPLDSKNNWFRYHHLFADLLRLKLNQKQSNLTAELLAKASRWCEENNLFEEAINYALAAKDWERALNLVEPMAFKQISVGKFDRIRHWVEAIPETELRTRPMVCYWYVPTLLYREEFDKAEEYMEVIGANASGELRQRLSSALWSSRCYITIARADLEKSLEFSQKSIDSLPPDDIIQHGVSKHAVLVTSLLQGDMKKSEQTALEGLPLYRQSNHFVFEVWGITYLSFVRAMQGKLREGAEGLLATIKYAKEVLPTRPDPQIYPHSFLCDIYRELNDIENAKIHLDEALTLIEQTGRESYVVLVSDNLKCLALMLQMSGDSKQALALIESGLSRMKKYGNETFARQLRALKALIYLRGGEMAPVISWAHSCGLSAVDEPTYQSELEHLTFARWLIAAGCAEPALPLLARLQKSAENGARGRVVIEVLILQAIAYQAAGDEEKALETLEQALVLAEPESYVRSFIDEGEALTKILRQLLKQNGKRWETENPARLRYVIKLNEASGTSEPRQKTPPSQAENLPWWYINDPLSERELEVMQQLSQGLSNHEIANKLFISTGTVKRHISNIYQKLDVHSRVQAVELARKFGLIPAGN